MGPPGQRQRLQIALHPHHQAVLPEVAAVVLPQRGSATRGDYAPALAACLRHSLRFQRAEGGFTLSFKQIWDGLPRALGDFIVRIVQFQRQKLRQPARQRALARPRACR